MSTAGSEHFVQQHLCQNGYDGFRPAHPPFNGTPWVVRSRDEVGLTYSLPARISRLGLRSEPRKLYSIEEVSFRG